MSPVCFFKGVGLNTGPSTVTARLRELVLELEYMPYGVFCGVLNLCI